MLRLAPSRNVRSHRGRERGARHFYFTYHTLTGRIFLRLSNGIVARLISDETPSSLCSLTGDVPRYNMHTVTTDPELNSNELFRTPLARTIWA